MKTIDSNALVQLNPDVIPVGNRPSPGVFEYSQELPPVACEPNTITIRATNLNLQPDSVVLLTAKITFGHAAPVQVLCNSNDLEVVHDYSRDLFSFFLRRLPISSVDGGGGVASFQNYVGWVKGGNGSLGGQRCSIEFVPTAPQVLSGFSDGRDLFESIFDAGLNSVVVHSCGSQYFEGL